MNKTVPTMEHDALDRRVLFVVYASAFVPWIGPWILILGTSVLYYVWRRQTPRRAAQLNRHAWIAWSLGMLASLGLFLFRRAG